MYDISIIIPSYNSEKTIYRTLDSIISQVTNANFEVLLIDDGSSDNTLEIEKSFVKNNINFKLYKQNHKFQAQARNLGIAKSNGKYLMFCDSDDEFMPNFIENMYNLISQSKLVIAGIEKCFYNSTKIIEVDSILSKANSKSELIGLYLTNNKEMDVGLWNKIFVKKIIIDNNIWMTNDNFFEDSLFVLKYLMAIKHSDIKFINEPLYRLIKRNGSTTNTFDSKLLEKCNNYINLVINLSSHFKIDKYLPSFKSRIILFYVHRNIVNNKFWNAKKQKRILLKILRFKNFKFLNLKYKIAIIFAFVLPNTYIKMYKKNN